MTGPAAATVPWSIGPDGLVLSVRLTPRGGSDAVDGIDALADGTAVFKMRVRAAATEGEANDALTRLVAKQFGVPPRAVAILSGHTARLKRLRVTGDPKSLLAKAEALGRKPAT